MVLDKVPYYCICAEDNYFNIFLSNNGHTVISCRNKSLNIYFITFIERIQRVPNARIKSYL